MLAAKPSEATSVPIYARAWNGARRFPARLYEGARNPPRSSGPAAAFFLSGGIGALAMMVAHHISETHKNVEGGVRRLGSWIPGSVSPDPMWGNIGSYAGKETVLILVWLGSLAILFPLLRYRNVKPGTLIFWLLGLYAVATLMVWHPLFPYLPLQ